MGYYPIMLDVTRRPAVIVGGQAEAEIKARGLLDAGASVLVIAPEVSDLIRQWAADGLVTWLPREATPADLRDRSVVIAATEDRETNRQVARWARTYGVLTNAVDDRDACDFFAVSHIRRGPLVISISTSGRAPVVAWALRRRLERWFAQGWEDLIDDVHALRVTSKTRLPADRRLEWLRRETLTRIARLLPEGPSDG